MSLLKLERCKRRLAQEATTSERRRARQAAPAGVAGSGPLQRNRRYLARVGVALSGLFLLLTPGSAFAQFVCVDASLSAGGSTATGANSVACGISQTAAGQRSVAVGFFNQATGDDSAAFGSSAKASGTASTALGLSALANGDFAVAVGDSASAIGVSSTAIGDQSAALGVGAVGVGARAAADADHSVAIGEDAWAKAAGGNSVAIGNAATAAAVGATAVGQKSHAFGVNSSAFGIGSVASGDNATAVGTSASATAVGATALGAGASATFANSTAIGNGASTSAPNQVAIGTASNTYRLSGITSAASLAAQSGTTYLVTSDASGNLATTGFSTAGLTSLQSQVTSLQSQVLDNRTEARTGTAIALAVGSMPALQPGRKFALSGGYGNFQGSNAFGLGATALVYDSKSYAVVVNAGAGIGLERNVAGGRGAVSVQW
nr:hypothetical protein [Bradyrhizobium sp. AS23.2]